MSRAVLLPIPGDPFLAQFWLKMYERWKGEVDRLYVYVNSPIPRFVMDYNKKKFQGVGAMVLTADHSKEHGECLRIMTMLASEDNIMFVEDDGFIFKSGKVNECFSKIESGEYDIVGSARGSCSQEILDKAQEKWGLDYSGFGDRGCNFWPNFFFTRKELLLKTDKNFGAKNWNPGETIRGLNMSANEQCIGDTFVSASLQLRNLTGKVWYENQYHGATNDQEDYNNRTNIWSPEASWLHVGSLSSGINNLLNPDKPLVAEFNTEQEKLELERRVAFWSLFYDESDPNDLVEYRERYRQGIDRLVAHYNLSPTRISKRKNIYREVLL